MQRYLIKFSYMGIRFRGLQRQPEEIFNDKFPYQASVQTILEKGLLRLRPSNEPSIQFSSRTDQGVHSFCNIAHVDLQHTSDGNAYPPKRVLKTLNKFLDKSDISLIVNDVEAVPPTFHARFSSLSRHYLYRIGITDSIVYPVIEWRKCYFVQNPFCVEKAVEACKLFEGTKDFSSFCHGYHRRLHDFPTVRTLDHFRIEPGRPLFNTAHDPVYSGITFYDFHIKARSFMYKQVRRMVSVVVAVAQNRMDLDDIRRLFEEPGEWNPRASTAPPYGLYLLNVDYTIPQDEQPQRSLEDSGTKPASSEDTSDNAERSGIL